MKGSYGRVQYPILIVQLNVDNAAQALAMVVLWLNGLWEKVRQPIQPKHLTKEGCKWSPSLHKVHKTHGKTQMHPQISLKGQRPDPAFCNQDENHYVSPESEVRLTDEVSRTPLTLYTVWVEDCLLLLSCPTACQNLFVADWKMQPWKTCQIFICQCQTAQTQRLIQEWDAIYMTKLVTSMRRCQAVLPVYGSSTCYWDYCLLNKWIVKLLVSADFNNLIQ